MSPPELSQRLNRPEETTAISSSPIPKEPEPAAIKPIRRFAPEPVETTTRRSRKAQPAPREADNDATGDLEPSREKLKEPINLAIPKTSTDPAHGSQQSVKSAVTEVSQTEPSQPSKTPRRKFAPQLIETAKRSRKAGDITPAVLPSDKTEVTPSDTRNGTKQSCCRPVQGTHKSSSQTGTAPTVEPRMRPQAGRSSSRGVARKHSFRVPMLESIESSDSDESGPPSLATSLSTSSGFSSSRKHGSKSRDSIDDRVSSYVLQFVSRSAEKRMQEQAMAAFPNSDHHEHIDHFVDRDSDDDDTIALEHDASGSEVNWELRAMLQHHEKLQNERQKDRRSVDLDRISSRSSTDPGPYGDPLAGFFPPSESIRESGEAMGGWQKDPCLSVMRSAASPPMLGGDLEFPRCNSPDPAQFEANETASTDPPQDTLPNAENDGLWHMDGRCIRHLSAGSISSHHEGLWRGFCDGSTQPLTMIQTGLLTPRVFSEECPECAASPSYPLEFPPSPPEVTSIDEKLMIEKAIQEEFDDTFITQVYNYLSLGYPALARKFDYELSKISGISVSELRQDDSVEQTRGYIGLGESGNSSSHETCIRWQALRIYIWEWARQQPLMSKLYPGGGAVAIRRGSWAI